MSEVAADNSQAVQSQSPSQSEPTPTSASAAAPEATTTRPQDLIIRFWSRFAIIVFVILAVLVLSSLVAPSLYARQRFHSQTITIADAEYDIHVSHPVKLFLGGEPSVLRISVWSKPSSVPTAPLVLRFAFGEGVIVTGTQPTINDRVAFVTFGPSIEPQVASLYLSSVGLSHADNSYLPFCVQTRQQCFGYGCAHVAVPSECNSEVIYLNLETPGQAASRNFLTVSVSDKAPILLVAALLAPVISQVIMLYQRQRENEQKSAEHRHQLEQERLERRNRQEQRRRMSEARSLADSVRQHLINANAQTAKTALQAIANQELSQYLSDQDRRWLEWLVEVANTSLDEPNLGPLSTPHADLHRLQAEWTDESAGAFVCTMERIEDRGNVSKDVRKLLGQFPLDRVSNVVLRDRYCRQWNKIQEVSLQERSQTKAPKPDKPTSLLLDKEAQDRKFVPRALLPHGRAEWEETKLFGGSQVLFWEKHPIYERLAHTPGNQFVYGQAGCGRTALALALYYGKLGFTDYLRVYIPLGKGTESGWGTIQRRWGEILLDYVCGKATRLFLLSEGQRLLLANVLVQALSYPYVVAHLPHMLDETLENKAPNESTKSNDVRTPDNKARSSFQQQVKGTQYELLAQAVQETIDLSPLSDDDWCHSTLACCKALGFSGVYLLLDYAAHATPSEQMLEGIGEWQEYGVTSTFFMPTSTFQTIQNNLTQGNKHELVWDTDDLKLLLDRLLYTLTEPTPVDRYFANGARNAFIQSVKPLTPRQLVHFWRKILQGVDRNARQITVEDIRRARDP